MRTIAKTFSEIMMERSQVAKAIGDTEEAAWMEGVAKRTAAKSAERISKASAVERAGNIIATRIGMAKPPARQEEITIDELDEAVTLALRRIGKAGGANGQEFDQALGDITKSDVDLAERWYEKAYDDEYNQTDILKKAKVMDVIDAKVAEIRKAEPELTEAGATVRIVEKFPALYTEYVS